jgi:hypothetical protein
MDRVQLLRARQRFAAPITDGMQTRRAADLRLTRVSVSVSVDWSLCSSPLWFMAAKKGLCE